MKRPNTEPHESLKGFDREDFMSYILKGYYANTLGREEIHQKAIILIIAGSETPATLLSGLTQHMLRLPHVYERLVRDVCGECKRYEDINAIKTNEFHYVRAMIEEALRIYPPAPNAFPRLTARQGESIAGNWVTGDTTVGVYQYAAHHYSGNFHRAEEFWPERWLAAQDCQGQIMM